MSSRPLLVFAAGSVLMLGLAATACGSPDSDALSRGAGSPTSGGAKSSSAGGAVSTGGSATAGAGGASFVGGFPSAGAPSGGVPGGGGAFESGGAGGAVPPGAGGAVPAGDAGPSAAGGPALPTGGLITQACQDCANQFCPDQTSACTADAACTATAQCLASCLLIQCVGCLANGNASPDTPSGALLCCTNQHCYGICPNFPRPLGTAPCP